EDGIRDFHVTGVQTCALPISVSAVLAGIGRAGYTAGSEPHHSRDESRRSGGAHQREVLLLNGPDLMYLKGIYQNLVDALQSHSRSEERRVGEEVMWRQDGDAW